MAFNLKTASEDTTVDGNAFLFGADSQSATDPSVYKVSTLVSYIVSLANTWTSTQTITPAANTNAIAVTGYSLSGTNAQSIIDLAGTWNTTGTPTAIKLNITNTASNASSLLMDLQKGGVSQFKVSHDGFIDVVSSGGLRSSGTLVLGGSSTTVMFGINTTADNDEVSIQTGGNPGITLSSGGVFGWSGAAYSNTTRDLVMARDAANTLGQRNGATAQESRVYGTYTDASNYRRLSKGMSTAGVAFLRPEGAGTGASGNVLHISGLPTSNPGPGILWNNAGTPAIGT